jgi:hypothetical protein
MEHMQEFLAFFTILCAIVGGAILLVVNLIFAVGVMRDGDRMREQGREPTFVGPNGWALGVLVGSFVVVALYWLIHHSSLRIVPAKAGEGS